MSDYSKRRREINSIKEMALSSGDSKIWNESIRQLASYGLMAKDEILEIAKEKANDNTKIIAADELYKLGEDTIAQIAKIGKHANPNVQNHCLSLIKKLRERV